MGNQNSSNFLAHIPELKYAPRWGVLLVDTFLCLIACIISFAIGSSLIRYQVTSLLLPMWQQAIIIVAVQLISFIIFRTYAGIIRYSTFVDIIKVLMAIILTSGLILITNLLCKLFGDVKPFLSSTLLIYLPTAFVLLFCLRVGVKTIYDVLVQRGGYHKRVMIYGTKSSGLAIAKMLRSSGSDSNYLPVGFITDAKDNKHFSIQGLDVYQLDDSLLNVLQRKNVHDVIVSPTKMHEINPSTDLEFFLQHNIHILTTPSICNWDKEAESHARIGRIESMQIENLLERPIIKIDTNNVSAIIAHQVVLVTGAAGSIGSELVRQIIKFDPALVVLLDQAESALHDLRLELKDQYPEIGLMSVIGDVRNKQRAEQIFKEYHPSIVFHAAAYKHVPLMEEYPNEAILANVLGTKNMADLAVKYNVDRFVMISTDKAVNPTNVMGASKRIAEIYVQALDRQLASSQPTHTKFITTRFGNVLGSNGSVIPYFKKQIAAGGPVTVTHPDIIRFFMTIPEACTLVMEAATLGDGGEIFIFDMGKPVRILELARNMIRLAGYQPDKDIPIIFTGLRPGEKLYEEVLNQKETTLPTKNDKIMIARVREMDYETVNKAVEEIISTSNTHNAMTTVKKMKEIVPEFISKNSIYEQLD